MVIAIALALLDFAPVFFLTLGLFFLAQLVDRLEPRCRRLAFSGLALVTLGALGRAAANLYFAISGSDLPLLSTTLYVLGGPGFVLMAASMMRARAAKRGKASPRDPWIAPMIVTWIFLAAAFYMNSSVRTGAWRPTLTILTLIGTILTALAAADLGWLRQLHMAALLFAFAIASAITLTILRALPAQPLLLQAFELMLNLAAQAAFAFAAWRVAAEYHARIGPTAGA